MSKLYMKKNRYKACLAGWILALCLLMTGCYSLRHDYQISLTRASESPVIQIFESKPLIIAMQPIRTDILPLDAPAYEVNLVLFQYFEDEVYVRYDIRFSVNKEGAILPDYNSIVLLAVYGNDNLLYQTYELSSHPDLSAMLSLTPDGIVVDSFVRFNRNYFQEEISYNKTMRMTLVDGTWDFVDPSQLVIQNIVTSGSEHDGKMS